MGVQIWMSWTIVAYILITVLVALLDKKNGFFLGKNVFLIENSIIFFEKINQNFNTTKWKMKP
jgi:hypothetical protein